VKFNLKLSRRQRIAVLYIIGLVLPGVILGLFAFRGLQNDQALREKQEAQELKLLTLELFKQLDHHLNQVLFALESGQAVEELPVLIAWSQIDPDQTRIVESNMTFWPDHRVAKIPAPALSEEVEVIQQLEHTSNNYELVIKQYSKLLQQSTRPDDQINALLGLTRLYKKTSQDEEASQVLQQLVDTFPIHSLPGGLPLKGLALTEIIRLGKQMNNQTSVESATDQLIGFLLQPDMILSESAFNYLNLQVQNLEISFSQEQRDKLSHNTIFAQQLHRLDQMSPGLLAQSNDFSYLENTGFPGLLFKSDSLKTGWVLAADSLLINAFTLLFIEVNPDGVYSWELIQNNDQLKTEQSDPLAGIVLPPGYPSWTLRLSKQELTHFEVLFQSSQGILLLVFVFIILLMVAGLVFMVYTLNQEMRVSKMKSQFISNVSHEFKTPLTSIQHMTEVMYLKRIDSEERKQEYLQSMMEQCDHLEHLIENILDFSKIEEDIKNYRFEEHQLDEIIKDLIPMFKGRIGNNDWVISLDIQDTPPPMQLDRDAIQQVLFNLLDNAYKYSGESHRIDLTLSFQISANSYQQRDKNQLACVKIRDYGIGIAEKDAGRIFERFYRGDRLRTEGIKGSGIGLTIVKRIVEAHGGRIEVTSKLNQGTTFSIYLPVNTVESGLRS